MRTIFVMIFVLCFGNLVQGQSNNNKTYKLLIGTYTSSGTSDGIYVYDFNTQTGDVIFDISFSANKYLQIK